MNPAFLLASPALKALLLYGLGLLFGWARVPVEVGVTCFAYGGILCVARRWRTVGLCLLVVGVGWLRWGIASYSPIRHAPDGATVDFEGVVLGRIADEQRVNLRVKGWIHVRAHGRAPLQPLYGTFLARCQPPPYPPPLRGRVGWGSIRYGTRLRFRAATLLQPSPSRNPGGYDSRAKLAQDDVFAVLKLTTEAQVEVGGVGGWAFLRTLDGFRGRLFAFFDRVLEPPHNALLAGILLGEKRALPPEILDDFVRGGVVHVLVVSGANFALLAGAAFVFLRALRVPLRAVYLATMGVSWLFALLVGFQPPVVRAGLVLTLYLTARLLERDADLFHVLALSAFLILLWHPLTLTDIGFQLSFGATAGIVCFVPKWNAALSGIRDRLMESRVGRIVWKGVIQTVLVTLAAELVTAPIVAYHFQRFYWVGILSNIPVLLLIECLTVGALIVAVAGVLWMPLGMVLGGAVWAGSALLLPMVRFFADFPNAAIPFSRPSIAELALYTLVVLTLTHLRRMREQPSRWILAGAGAVACLAWSVALQPLSGLLQVTFLDVGQGDAAVVRLPDGKTLLVDAGARSPEFDNGERTVTPYLLSQRIRRLDWAMLSHPDLDHGGGLASVLNAIPTRELVGLSDAPSPKKTFQTLRQVALERGVRTDNANDERLLHETDFDGKTLKIAMFRPPASFGDTNNNSLMAKIEYGKCRILFTGDIEAEAEQALVVSQNAESLDASTGSARRLRADFLKTPHHGSKSSSSEAFLDAVRPRFAVMSLGVRNPFGFPSEEVLERYRARGVSVLRTDTLGGIQLLSDGERCWVIPTETD